MTRAMDPTSRGDIVASVVRDWYERNRETWWDRHCGPGWPVGPGTDRSGAHADEFMLRLVNKVREIDALSDMELVRDYS
jgi:hypothetical protein